MKTTVDLPDDLLIEAKKRAIEERTTLRELITRALRRELRDEDRPRKKKPIQWVTHPGGVSPEADPGDRETFYEWVESRR